MMETPGRGWPFSDWTFPETGGFVSAAMMIRGKKNKSSNSTLIKCFLVFFVNKLPATSIEVSVPLQYGYLIYFSTLMLLPSFTIWKLLTEPSEPRIYDKESLLLKVP